MIESYKILNNIYDPLTTKTLKNLNKDLTTRSHPFKLYKPRVNTNKYHYFFTNRIINTWNNLPENVVMAETINSFKNRLDKHWGHIKFSTNIIKDGL